MEKGSSSPGLFSDVHNSLDNFEIKRDRHKTGKLPDRSQEELSFHLEAAFRKHNRYRRSHN